MKRALCEWGAMLFVTIAVTCGIYWCISCISDRASFAMILGDEIFMFREGGAIWTNRLDAPTSIEEFDQGRIVPTAAPQIDVRVALLGVTYRKLTWANPLRTWDQWMLRVSLVLPTLVSALLATFCVWRYRRLRTAAAGKLPA